MTIIINLRGADARFTASIAQLLKLKTKDKFALGDYGEITLIDADSIEGRKFAEKKLNNKTVLLTVTPESFSHNLIVRKPIKIDELLAVLESIDPNAKKIEIVENQDAGETATHVNSNPFAKYSDPEYLKTLRAAPKEVSNPKQEEPHKEKELETVQNHLSNQEKTFQHWKADLEKIIHLEPYTYDDHFFAELEKSQILELSNIYFQTEDIYCDLSNKGTLSLFNKVFKKEISSDIYYFNLASGIVFLFPDDVLLSNLTFKKDGEFFDVLAEEVVLHKVETKDEFLELISQFEDYYYHNEILNVLSRLILLEAKGRIINHKNIEEPLGLLKKTDKFQNLLNIPFSAEIDSIWEFRNISLREIIDLLPEISPYYIFSYYTLCELYRLFDHESTDGKGKKQLDLNELILELQKL